MVEEHAKGADVNHKEWEDMAAERWGPPPYSGGSSLHYVVERDKRRAESVWSDACDKLGTNESGYPCSAMVDWTLEHIYLDLSDMTDAEPSISIPMPLLIEALEAAGYTVTREGSSDVK